jgi:hypothetical protein
LTFLLHNKVVVSTKLGPGIDFLDWGVSWILSIRSGKFRDSASSYATTAFFRYLSKSQFTNHSLIPSYSPTISATECIVE